jgi:hypothetical protein
MRNWTGVQPLAEHVGVEPRLELADVLGVNRTAVVRVEEGEVQRVAAVAIEGAFEMADVDRLMRATVADSHALFPTGNDCRAGFVIFSFASGVATDRFNLPQPSYARATKL